MKFILTMSVPFLLCCCSRNSLFLQCVDHHVHLVFRPHIKLSFLRINNRQQKQYYHELCVRCCSSFVSSFRFSISSPATEGIRQEWRRKHLKGKWNESNASHQCNLIGQMLKQETCFKRLKRMSWVLSLKSMVKRSEKGDFWTKRKMLRPTDIGGPFGKVNCSFTFENVNGTRSTERHT